MFDAQVALVVGSAFGSRRVRSLAGRRIPHVGRIQNGDVFRGLQRGEDTGRPSALFSPHVAGKS